DYIMDDTNWKIDYLVVECGSWLNSRKVLLSTQNITEVNWENKTVIVNISTEQVKDSPEYDDSKPLDEQYEKSLSDYYSHA
ncbi:MAG: hypothetical protein ABI359_09590, partial [Ginsengibacter sp.]